MGAGMLGSSSGISAQRARNRSMLLLRTTRINQFLIWSGSCTEASFVQAVMNDSCTTSSVARRLIG